MGNAAEVVVTGVGAITPAGVGLAKLVEAGKAGRSGISALPEAEVARLSVPVKVYAPVTDFDPASVLDAKQVRLAARLVQFAVGCAVQATGSHDQETCALGDVSNFGTIIGTSTGGLEVITDTMETLSKKGPRRVSPFAVPQIMDNAAAAWVALRWGFHGPAYALSTACATGLDAIGLAYEMVRTGRLDGALAGGTEAALCPILYATFDRAGLATRSGDAPALASKPFDKDRDGLVLGEGAGLMLLERRDRAEARGAHIIARVLGFGTSGRPQPEFLNPRADGEGLATAMRLAMQEAKVTPADIGYISATAMGLPITDAAEANAIHSCFGPHAKTVPVGATKSMVGYTLGAAGAIGALAATVAVHDGVLLPDVSFKTPDPQCDLNIIGGEARQQSVKYALANAIGFGGANSSVVFGAP